MNHLHNILVFFISSSLSRLIAIAVLTPPGIALGLLVATPYAATAQTANEGEKEATPGVVQPDGESTQPPTEDADGQDDLSFNNPGSSVAQLKEDAEKRNYLFQIPGVDEVLVPWYSFEDELEEKYGLKFGISFTHLYQWASDTVGPENEASGFELAFDATWTPFGRGTKSPTIIGLEVLYRDSLGTDIPPAPLFTQISSLYPTSVAFAEVGPAVGQFWIQQRFDGKFGFQVGKYNPVPVYDFFPMKNFRTNFVDGVHAANVIIPLPSRGLGGFLMFRPQPNVYLRVGLHDANADAEEVGFNTLFDDGELFTIFEAGFDPLLAESQPGRPPAGDIHVSVWHQDRRDDAHMDEGWGFVLSGTQRFGDFLPFLRYGYSDSDRGGPTPMEHMINGGVGIDNIFGRADDRIGIGFTWARPGDESLDDQKTIDVFYRVQVTPEIAVTPILQFLFDPVRNPDEDQVVVIGIRTRWEF
jgi:porin